jgi:hypothetical protein
MLAGKDWKDFQSCFLENQCNFPKLDKIVDFYKISFTFFKSVTPKLSCPVCVRDTNGVNVSSKAEYDDFWPSVVDKHR